jgi:hypothetical protein
MSRRVENLLITPGLAEEMLKRRKPGQITRFDRRQAIVLHDRIKRDGYKECNDLWVVDVDGDLANGQHRAWAVKELGISVRQHVVFDAPVEEFEVTDTHRARNRAMQFTIAGVENAKVVSTSLMACMEFIHGRFRVGDANYIRSRLSKAQLIEAYQKSAFLENCVSTMVAGKKRKALGQYGPFYKAVFSSVDPFLWEDFFGKLNGDLPTTKDDVEFQLRLRLLDTGLKKLQQTQRDAMIVLSWNYRVANRKIKILAWDKAKQGFPEIDGTTPERFAQFAGLPLFPEYVKQP